MTDCHTSGQYYYIEASSPRVQGERAHLVSQTFSGSAGTSQCLSFWYHMYGVGTGTLRVRTQINGVDTVRWALTGDQGNQWRNGQVSVGEAGDYQVLTEFVSIYYTFTILNVTRLRLITVFGLDLVVGGGGEENSMV